ncbi:MAG: hypothetical protein QXX94_04535 [Candidatus Bathyarchaeia archaeon]
MSKLIFTLIFNEVLNRGRINVSLSDSEIDQLYRELLNYFGLAGGLNICESLERAWQDPYNRDEIERFIMAWLRRKIRGIQREYRSGIV